MATPRPALGHALDRPLTGPAAGPDRGASRARRRAGVVLGATAAACAALTALPGPASAQPTTDQLTQQVAAAGHQLEALDEQLDQAHLQLDQQRATAARADADGAAARARLATMDGQIRQLARSAYTTGDVSRLDAILTSGSPAEMLARMQTLDAVAGHQDAIVQQASAAAAQARRARQQADEATAAAQRTLDGITAQEGTLRAQVADWKQQYAALTAAQQQAVVRATSGEAAPAPAAPVAQAVAAPVGAAPAVAAPVAAAPAVAAPAGGAAQTAVRTALAQVGKPYAWGAAGPGAFDCSGLTMYAYRSAGVSLPHSSGAQSRMGTPVSKSQLQPGDLLFFGSPVVHVAMYVGGGQMVHASTEGQPVKVVPVESLHDFNSARRIG